MVRAIHNWVSEHIHAPSNLDKVILFLPLAVVWLFTLPIVGPMLSLALCVLFISYQCKETKKLCIVQGVSSSLFALSYFLLGAYTGCILNVINIFRGIFFGFAPKKRQNVLLIMLALMYIAATAVTYSDFFSLLILVAQLVGAFSVWLGDGKKLRILQLCVVSPVWLIYNIKVVSIGGIVGESFSILSVIISFIRFGADGFSESGEKKKPRK